MHALLILLLLGLAACRPECEAQPDATADRVGTAIADTAETPYFVFSGDRALPPAQPIRDAAWRAESRDYLRLSFSVRDSVDHAADWREAEAIVRRHSASVPESRLANYDVSTATQLLDRHLLQAPLDPETADALGHYTRVLVDHGSQQGAVILKALDRLGGRWTERERAGAARAAASVLGRVYTDQAGCVDCMVDEALAGMPPNLRAANEAQLPRLAAVHRRLREIARFGGR